MVDNQEILLDVRTRILSFFNDCFFATTEGIDWFNNLGSKDRDVIILDVTKTINSTNGVRRINSVDFFESASRNLTINYNIDTIFSVNNSASLEVLSA